MPRSIRRQPMPPFLRALPVLSAGPVRRRRVAPRGKLLAALAALGLGLLAGALPAPARAGTPGEVRPGQPLRDEAMQGLNGPAARLSQFRGRPLIINVWASWCGPCRAEMASLERLAWREPSAGPFTIIGISTDDDPDAARAQLRRSNATISHYIDSQLRLENMLGASQLPLTVLVDAEGRVREKVYGAREWDGAEALALIGRTFRGARRGGPR
jgi:thiol-disulfide isomerase/thioredoxin